MFDNPQALQQLMIAGGLLDGSMSMGQAGQGLLNMQTAARQGDQFAQQQKLMQMKMDEYQRKQKEREAANARWQQAVGTPAQQAPYRMSESEMFPGEQQIPGLLNETPATGMMAQDPQTAQVMSLLGPEQGRQLLADMYKAQIKPNDDAKAMEIQRLQQNLGVDLPTATGIAYGTIKTTAPDPQGNVGIIDIGKNKLIGSFNIASREGPSPTPATGLTADSYLIKAAEKGTGPGAAIKSSINNVIGWAVEGVPFEDASKARQNLREFNQFVIQSLVNNPRAPVAEQQNIRAFQPDPDKFLKDPDEAKAQIQSLHRFLEEKRQAYQSSLQNKNLPLDERSKLQSQLAGVERVLQMMNRKTGEDQKKILSDKYGVELD